MAGYAFETMSADDAAAFGTDDYLFFVTGASARDVQVMSYENGAIGTGINLTYAGKTLTFANAISQASFNNHIQFNDGSHLQIGTEAADTGGAGTGGAANTGFTLPTDGQPVTAYGLGGNDTIDYSAAGAGRADYINGGFGVDTLRGGDANNHIYGNSQYTQQGALDSNGNTDGGDHIFAGGGTNYVNGNGGDDDIHLGTLASGSGSTAVDASTGANRAYGGSGDDSITLVGQGANYANGNVGNDTIDASNSTGNNTLRGGQDSDTIYAGHGQTVLMGDVGDDTLVAGSGGMTALNDGASTQKLTIMTGGAGNDTFDFSGTTHPTGSGQADFTNAAYAGTVQGTNDVHSGIVIGGQTYWQTITDFTQGSDTIHLGFNVDDTNGIVHAQSGITFSSESAAEVYANQILANNEANNTLTGGDVAALDVNGSTYLFFSHTGSLATSDTPNHIDSVIQLTGVSSSTLTQGGSGIHTFS